MAWIAPIAVAAAQKEEEERVIRELRHRFGRAWEFKVLRSASFAFGNPDRLQEALMEESAAEWQLAQRLDDNRLILRRPIAARENDVLLGDKYNPYREHYGSGYAWLMGIALGLVVLGTVALLLFQLKSTVLTFIILGAIVMLALIMGVAVIANNTLARRRRKRKG
jgi:hypothetical protein